MEIVGRLVVITNKDCFFTHIIYLLNIFVQEKIVEKSPIVPIECVARIVLMVFCVEMKRNAPFKRCNLFRHFHFSIFYHLLTRMLPTQC